jgi:hypothetical protein
VKEKLALTSVSIWQTLFPETLKTSQKWLEARNKFGEVTGCKYHVEKPATLLLNKNKTTWNGN